MLDFNTTGVYPMRVGSLRCADAVFRIVDPVDFPRARDCREFVDRSSAAATDIENVAVRLDRGMTQSPIGQLRMMPIHVPQNKPAEKTRRLPALRNDFVGGAHCF